MVSTETPASSEGRKSGQFLAAFAATILALSAGTSTAWTAPALGPLTRGEQEPVITEEEGSWLGSLLTLGALLGSIPAGRLADLLGPKRLLMILSIPMTFGWLLLLVNESIYYFYVGRVILGFCFGTMCVVIPNYLTDLSEPSVRGTVGVLFLLQVNFGVFIMYMIGFVESVFYMTLICSIVPPFFALCFAWMPESPVFLASKGELDRAENSLLFFRGRTYDTGSELKRIQDQVSESNYAGIIDLLRDPLARRGIFISTFLMFVQQMCGINAIVFYMAKVIDLTGSGMDPNLSSSVLGFVVFAGTAFGMATTDLAGRRFLLVTTAGILSASLGGIALFIKYQPPNLSWVPISLLGIYFFAYATGWSSIPWIMMSEMFFKRFKGVASSITSFTSWGLGFIVTRFFQDVVDLIGVVNVFFYFAFASFIGLIFVVCFVPETKGKTIEEIAAQLGGPKAMNNVIPE